MDAGIGEHLSGTDIGVVVFAVAYLLGKIADFVLKIKENKNNNDKIMTPTEQNVLCKEHHTQLLIALKEHKTDADGYMREAFELLRANASALQAIKVSILKLQALEKSVKALLDNWRIDYDQLRLTIERTNSMIIEVKKVTDKWGK